MKFELIILACVIAAGCVTNTTKTIVLDYYDFGPQVMSYETIGMSYWQWDNHGDPDQSHHCDVKVVVYRNIQLQTVKKTYPVVKDKEQDYRYLSYAKAMAYLDTNIQENVIPELTQHLRFTQSRIAKKLGKPKAGKPRPKYQAPQKEHPETVQNLEKFDIHANHVEAFNSCLRRRLAVFRRKTNTFRGSSFLQKNLNLES